MLLRLSGYEFKYGIIIFFFFKIKIELPQDPAIPLLGIYPDITAIQKDTCIPIFIATLFTIDKT